MGDMGPKFNYTSKGNGWAMFNSVRIPREQMLNRYVNVDREGTFSIEGDIRVLFTVMMNIRNTLIIHSAESLMRGLLIAGRYCAVRRQFKDKDRQERKLLDYQTQQMKLFPLLGGMFANLMASDYVRKNFQDMKDGFTRNDFQLLDVMHHLTSGFKALFTQNTNDGLYQIRQAIGGAGFTEWSGIPVIINRFSPCVTFEGDNTVMLQQSAKYLLKLSKNVRKGEPVDGIFYYLNNLNRLDNLTCLC